MLLKNADAEEFKNIENEIRVFRIRNPHPYKNTNIIKILHKIVTFILQISNIES